VSETRQELEATIAARRELGREHEPELIDAFLERLEQRLAERGGPAPASQSSVEKRRQQFVIALTSLGTGIPITAIAAGTEGAPGLVIAWAGIAAVNYVFSRQR
jgi:hypothetical protein